jgi:hypothetical protein
MSARTRGLLIGFVAGAVTATAWPLLGALASDIVRPVSKAFMKQGILGAERLRAALARASEAVEDLLAELRVEVEAELDKRSHDGAPSATPSAPHQARAPRTGSSNLS